MGDEQGESNISMCDNIWAISFPQNPIQQERTKHIPVKCHSLKEFEGNRKVKLEYVRPKDNVANIFIKPFSKKQVWGIEKYF